MNSKLGYPVLENRREEPKEKDKGCWAKFKSFFEDRGFDLEYEYNDRPSVDVLETQTDFEGYRRISVSKSKAVSSTKLNSNLSPDNLDGELSGVINFYEQFASLGDETKDDDLWKRPSTAAAVRHRVSMRPSMYLTNITEEGSIGDDEEIEVEVNRSPPPAQIPSSLIYAPPEPLELLCVFPERVSRVCAAACGAAARAGGEARAVRSAREALDALRRDGDNRVPHVIVADARQPQALDAILMASNYSKKAFITLRVQYNNAFRRMLGLPWRCSSSGIFPDCGTDGFHAVLRKRVAYLWERVRGSSNILLKTVAEKPDSPILIHWMTMHEKVMVSPYYLYWGYFNGRANVYYKGKWEEKEWFLCDHYLPYALGGGYVISKYIVDFIGRNHQLFSRYNSEDVSLGVWTAALSGIHRVHDIRFDTEWISRGCSNNMLVRHKQTSVNMEKMFKNLVQTKGEKLCMTDETARRNYMYKWNVLPSQCCKT